MMIAERRLSTVLALALLSSPIALGCRPHGAAEHTFTISIDEAMQRKWGFRYPVTYVFQLSGAPPGAEARRRDGGSSRWVSLPERAAGDLFNGVECVRFDSAASRAYVSVGFRTGNTLELQFANIASVTFDSVARYYDNRKAAYTLSNDNWGRLPTANPGAPWHGMTDDRSDKYQAAVHACRMHHIPVSIAINSRMAGGEGMWQRMQDELDHADYSWEPAVHTQSHPDNGAAYNARGHTWQILGCRDEILKRLRKIPYGQHVFEFILPAGYQDATVKSAAAGEFLFVRAWNGRGDPSSTDYTPWNGQHGFHGPGGCETISYDVVLQSRRPQGRYCASDLAKLNRAFDEVHAKGGIFYAMWHSDRYQNSVIHDPRPGVDGVSGSTLMQHLAYVANRRDVWYVANGWLYSYRYVAQNARVVQEDSP